MTAGKRRTRNQLDRQANDQREEREPFDEGRGDDHAGLNTASSFGLAGHRLERTCGQLADPERTAESRQSGAEIAAEIDDWASRGGGRSGRLSKRGCGEYQQAQQLDA